MGAGDSPVPWLSSSLLQLSLVRALRVPETTLHGRVYRIKRSLGLLSWVARAAASVDGI